MTATESGRNFNREIGRQVCETVFGGLPKTTLLVLAEVWEGDAEGTWDAIVESGYLLTDLHREKELTKNFQSFEEACDHAKRVSKEWRVKRGYWNKGDKSK